MDIGAILMGSALLVGSLAITLSPFQKRDSGKIYRGSRLRKPSLEELHQAALTAILDLDFDYSIGKVTQEDYTVLRASLIQKAAEHSAQPADEDQIEALIRARREKLGKTPKEVTCPKCGKTLTAEDRFCSGCGSPLAEKCPGCGKPISPRDLYCSGCGRLLKLPTPSTPNPQVIE